MKFKFYTLVSLLLVCLFAFTSCEEEQIIQKPTTLQPLEGQAYLNATNLPSILFQFESFNTLTGDNEGWLIDDEGNLRTYENAGKSILSMNTDFELNRFLNATEVIDQVDVDALVEHIRYSGILAALSLTNVNIANNSDIKTSYYAYHMRYAEQQCSNCNTVGENKETHDAYIERFILESEGDMFQLREDVRVEAAVEWLKMLGEDMN